MRLLSFLISTVIAIQPLWNLSAIASTINYAPGSGANHSSIDGEAIVKHVGTLTAEHGTAVISGNRLDIIFASADLTEKRTVLTGTTFNTTVTGQGKTGKITGLVLFDGGASLTQIYNPETKDLVMLSDGGSYSGQITGLTEERLEITSAGGARTIDTASIREIRSSRVFKFTLPFTASTNIDEQNKFQAETSQIAFSSTSSTTMNAHASTQAVTKTATSAPPSSSNESGRVRRLVFTILILGAIATAIAVPIAVGVATHHHHHNNAGQQVALVNYLRAQQAANAAPAASLAP